MSTYLDQEQLALLITDMDLVKYTDATKYLDQWQREVDNAERYFDIVLTKRDLPTYADWTEVTEPVRQLIVAYLHKHMSLHRIGNNPQQSDTGLVYDLYKSKYDIYCDVFAMLEAGLTDELITGVADDTGVPSYVIPIVRR